MWQRALGGLVASSILLVAADAAAAGLYFSDRGVRPMARAGAFVAGADDAGAIWYNPAGLADAGSSIVADFTWVRFRSRYDRQLRIVDAQGTVQIVDSPTVEGSAPILPLPTLVGAVEVTDGLVVAAGVYAPYVALASYPDTVRGQPSPGRYTLGSFESSRLALPGVWAGWAPADWLRVGLGLQALVGTFRSTITFNVSPQDRLIGAPEQTEFDGDTELAVGPMFAPSVNGGIILIPDQSFRIGVSAHSTTSVDSDSQLDIKLPTSAVFDSAELSGRNARVQFELAPILRAGAEFRTGDLRVEGTWVREFWSVHDAIRVTPDNMSIRGIVGLPEQIDIPPINIPRNFRDANSFRLGAEYAFELEGYTLQPRAGIAIEESAVPPEYLSLSSADFDKVVVSIGGSLYVGEGWRLDALYAHLFASETYVDPAQARIPRINPLPGNAPFESVNGGTYSASADLIGFGLEYSFDETGATKRGPKKAKQPVRARPKQQPAERQPVEEQPAPAEKDESRYSDEELTSPSGVAPAEVDLDEDE